MEADTGDRLATILLKYQPQSGNGQDSIKSIINGKISLGNIAKYFYFKDCRNLVSKS